MKTTTLAKTTEKISAIGFGGMPLSITGRPAEDVAREVVHAAIDVGLTLIDTADVYCLDDDEIGHNERLIASAVPGAPRRDEVRIATKAGLRRPRGAWTNDGTPKHIREACEKSLRALGTEQIWLYQFHAPDPGIPFEKSVEAFAELQRQGKCRYVGLSNVSVEQIDRASRIVDIVSVQNRLNPFFREAIENGVVAECARREMTFLAYSPLGGGRLTKKIPNIPVLQELARKHGASPHAITIAWVRAQGMTVVPIPGARKVENALDSARAAGVALTPEEIARIDESEFSRS
jgi:aryl-alcohol dehydrogenase-like predicted oxidoreductase